MVYIITVIAFSLVSSANPVLDYFFQKEGKNKMRVVNISSLPINMSHASNHLPGAEI